MNQDIPTFMVTITSPKGEVHIADDVGASDNEGAKIRAFAVAWCARNKFRHEFKWPDHRSASWAYETAVAMGFSFSCEQR